MSSPKPTRGYARNEKDQKRLETIGLLPRQIYREDRGEILGKFKMRKGEFLGVVDGLRVFGTTRRQIDKAIDLVQSWNAEVLDVETGLTTARDGVKMLTQALNPPKPTPEYMAQLRALGLDKRVKGRMPIKSAEIIWHGHPTWSNAEVLDLMPGWTRASAYNHFGPRKVIAGRRPKCPA
jgi:hypothetical protein